MKKLLTMLGAITLIGTASTNIIACVGGGQEPINLENSEEDKIGDLLSRAQEKIKEEFGELIGGEKNQNLFFSNEFANGENFYSLLKGLSNRNVVSIDDTSFNSTFSAKIQNIIDSEIASKLILDDNLRLLFNGISNNNILKIKTANFKKIPFSWKKEDVNFGIKNYDPGGVKLNITYWYSIKVNLSLLLSYKDKNNRLQNKDILQEYNIYFANESANIAEVIKAASLKIDEKIKNFLMNIELTVDDIADDKNIIDKAKQVLLNTILKDSKITINNATLLQNTSFRMKEDSYSEANHFYNAFNKTSSNSVIYLKDYFTKIVKNFDEDLNQWINLNLDNTKKIQIEEDKQNIKNFGKISLNDWVISGLTLKKITFNFITVRKYQTREQWKDFVSTALGEIFSLSGIIKSPFNVINNQQNLIMYMDKEDFDSYLSEDERLNEINCYFSEKIKEMAVREKLISDTTQFRIVLNGSWEENATLQNSEFINKIDDDTLEVTKNPQGYYSYLRINIDGFDFFFGNKKGGDEKNKNNYVTFNKWIIKRANSNIWN